MRGGAQYVKIVEWSPEDRCFVGSCPGLIYGGCHGDDERAVFAELCEIVDEVIERYKKDGMVLPPPTAGRDYANKMLERGASRKAPRKWPSLSATGAPLDGGSGADPWGGQQSDGKVLKE